MFQAGDVLVHPTGARIRVESWDGRPDGILVYQLTLPGRGGRLPEHSHADQTQEFQVLKGAARYTLAGQEGVLAVGQSVVVPTGTVHVNPWNDTDAELVLRAVCRPAAGEAETWVRLGFART